MICLFYCSFSRLKPGSDGGLSAKNLIDAIITQSINKGTNETSTMPTSMTKYVSQFLFLCFVEIMDHTKNNHHTVVSIKK